MAPLAAPIASPLTSQAVSAPNVQPDLIEPAAGPRAGFLRFFAAVAQLHPFERAWLLTTMPNGRLQVCQSVRPAGRLSDQSANVGPALQRLGWRAIATETATTTDPAGGRLIAIRVKSPVFAGFAGVLILEEPAKADVANIAVDPGLVREILQQLYAAVPMAADAPTSQYVCRSDGTPLMPADAPDDVRAIARTAAESPETDAPHRVLISRSPGSHEAASVSRVAEDNVLAESGGSVVVSVFPRIEDWQRLSPFHFAADEELARLTRAVAYMVAQFPTGPTLGQIAESVQLSQFHFHRRFTDRFGVTPKQVLFELQLDKARTMLADRTCAMTNIARDCGFAHQSHFTSRFKQGTAQTPSAWRRQALKRDST